MMSIDPVTLEVIRNGLAAAAEEMNASLIRTSYSPNIKERRDCSCAIFDDSGEMISQAENIPVHLGAMPFSVREALSSMDEFSLEAGDGILLNDPFRGGAHLPDLTLITPIFADDKLVGYAANRAHHADVGGVHAGSVAADATDIYQEGVRIPPVRAFAAGEPVEDVLAVILANTRDPAERRGDLRAQLAANVTGSRRVAELVDRHGMGTMQAGIEEIKTYSERRMRAAIGEIPDGKYTCKDVLEDDGRGNEDLPVVVTITVAKNELRLDFAGSAPQTAGAVNAVRAVTVSACYYAVRCLTDPSIPPNAGCYRPISVDLPDRSIVNASPPAAVVAGNLETSQRVVDVVLGAFAATDPERTIAGSQGTMNNVTFGGDHPDEDRSFAFYETQAGGMGARAGADGIDGVQVHMTNTMNTPVEVIETAYPLRVVRYELRPDSAGPGTWRGGVGLRRDIAVRFGPLECSLLAERRRSGPAGIAGGGDGQPGADYLIRDGEPARIPQKSSHRLNAGDIVSIRTPGGGGFGSPADRDPSAIRRDLDRGLLTEDEARRRYGSLVDDGDPGDSDH